jgi:hypothetical protein
MDETSQDTTRSISVEKFGDDQMKEIQKYKEKYECSAEAMQYAFEI